MLDGSAVISITVVAEVKVRSVTAMPGINFNPVIERCQIVANITNIIDIVSVFVRAEGILNRNFTRLQMINFSLIVSFRTLDVDIERNHSSINYIFRSSNNEPVLGGYILSGRN